jgi:hypothetical protein
VISISGGKCIVVPDDYTSGVVIYRVYLFGTCPVGRGDKKPWKLLYIGRVPEEGDLKGDLGRVQLKADTGQLIAEDTSGRVVRKMDIHRELKMVKEANRKR